ncbi:ribosome-recycling factor, chloroplastic-like [Cryptomeria japonica]|uniref:ribosome-recycling factor, chloroplastic-like n=1 Tax=Cryptomeria japonica TaxID=3369 RepID=UPI0027DA6004|nr:ribosome-recycling factor, chloroplastic-like [Cryptomeria japonica]
MPIVSRGFGYGVKPFVGSNCRHAMIPAGRNSTYSIRSLAYKDGFFGKSLILRPFQQKRNVRIGACRCATSEETYEEKQLTEEDARERMSKTLEAMKSNFNSIRTGRSSPALLDRIEVEYYASPINLTSLAQVSVTEGNSLLIQPFDKSSVKPIEKAISKSNLGLTPSSDGNIIRLNIPQLTAERRKDVAVKSLIDQDLYEERLEEFL